MIAERALLAAIARATRTPRTCGRSARPSDST
jgi:hypothetical protein